MAGSKPALVLIKGESISNVPSYTSLKQLTSLLMANGYASSNVYNKENMLTFTGPEMAEDAGDTLIIFDAKGKMSFCKYDERYAKEADFFN
jgi:hypothetical protein